MSKLYIPENVWLVCSEGTSTQQMLVTSQSKVKIDGGYLMATTADRVKTDFGCKKEALADAIGVAICAMVIAQIATPMAVFTNEIHIKYNH